MWGGGGGFGDLREPHGGPGDPPSASEGHFTEGGAGERPPGGPLRSKLKI